MSPLIAPKPAPTRDAKAVRDEIMQLVGEYYDLVHTPAPFFPGRSAAPVNGRVFDASDIRSLVDSALEFWLTTGRFNAEFQQRLAARIGVRYALTPLHKLGQGANAAICFSRYFNPPRAANAPATVGLPLSIYSNPTAIIPPSTGPTT